MTIRIRSTFSSIIQPNTNTLFGLIFGPNRIFGTTLLVLLLEFHYVEGYWHHLDILVLADIGSLCM